MMKKLLLGIAVCGCVNVNAMESIQNCFYVDFSSYKIKIKELAQKASITLQRTLENSNIDTSPVEDLVKEAAESSEGLEKLAELVCSEQTDLDGAMKVWEVSSSIRIHSREKQDKVNKVTAMIGTILSDWCRGRALKPEEYLSNYYNGWYDQLVSDDNAK